MNDLGIIRQLYDLPSVVERLTGMAVHKKMVCPMPFHQHHNMSPSFGMFVDVDGTQRFKCFGQCGAQGDVIDFVGYYILGTGYDTNNAEHVQTALAYLRGGTICAHKTPLQKKHKPLDQRIIRPLVKQWEEALWDCEQAQDYLERRGILSVARQLHLGYRVIEPEYVHMEAGSPVMGHYISIPTIENGQIVSVKLRRIDSFYQENKPIRYDSVAGSKIGAGQPGVFNHDGVAFKSGPVFCPEGELNAALIIAMGFQACSLNSGGNVLSDKLALILAHADPIFLEDNDSTGKRHAQQKRELCGKGIILNTAPFKDIGEMYETEKQPGNERQVLVFLERAIDLGCGRTAG